MKVRWLLAAAVLAFTACKKDKSEERPYKGNVCDYAPYTNGSSFTFYNITSTGDTTIYTLEGKGDSLLNGQAWLVMQEQSSGEKTLFRCGNGDYEQLADYSGFPGGPADPVRNVYLRESMNLGGSWTETILVDLPVFGKVNLTLTNTIMQKGTSKTVLGQRFENVIGVRTDFSVPPILPAETLFTRYFAKGVGMIQVDTEQDTAVIFSYSIPQ